MTRACRAASGDDGFSATEVLVVAAMAITLTVWTTAVFGSTAATVQGDADMQVVHGQVKFARETAINQRRLVEVRFTSPNLIEVIRHNLPNGTTVISSAYLEHHAQFTVFDGVPDSPDGFGRTTPIDFGGSAAVMFTAEGTFVDEDGQPVNGTVFLGQPSRPLTARAVTVFGPTAMIRTYRWNGAAWSR
ncbi:MAG: hypothetical protein IT184_08660 [Acidobacteria bacterium]|nr:hypothetical protein [Acidobacteriota bacterium]